MCELKVSRLRLQGLGSRAQVLCHHRSTKTADFRLIKNHSSGKQDHNKRPKVCLKILTIIVIIVIIILTVSFKAIIMESCLFKVGWAWHSGLAIYGVGDL